MQLNTSFLEILKDLMGQGLILENQTKNARDNFIQKIDLTMQLCAQGKPINLSEVEDFLALILFLFDEDMLMEDAPIQFKQLFIDCLEIAGNACARAMEVEVTVH